MTYISDSDFIECYPAVENFDEIADRLAQLFLHDRKVTLIRQLVNETGPDQLDVHKDLVLDREMGVRSIRQEDPVHRGFKIYFTGVESFAVGTDFVFDREARQAWNYPKPGHSATRLRIDGFGNEPSTQDSIFVERINEHGVRMQTTVIFHR